VLICRKNLSGDLRQPSIRKKRILNEVKIAANGCMGGLERMSLDLNIARPGVMRKNEGEVFKDYFKSSSANRKGEKAVV